MNPLQFLGLILGQRSYFNKVFSCIIAKYLIITKMTKILTIQDSCHSFYYSLRTIKLKNIKEYIYESNKVTAPLIKLYFFIKYRY